MSRKPRYSAPSEPPSEPPSTPEPAVTEPARFKVKRGYALIYPWNNDCWAKEHQVVDLSHPLPQRWVAQSGQDHKLIPVEADTPVTAPLSTVGQGRITAWERKRGNLPREETRAERAVKKAGVVVDDLPDEDPEPARPEMTESDE